MHAALGLALSTMVWIVAFLIGMCFEADVMSMAYVTFLNATLWCGMSIAGCIGAHRIERGCGSMVCIPHAIQVRLVFCMSCADWHIWYGYVWFWRAKLEFVCEFASTSLFCSCGSFCDHTFR